MDRSHARRLLGCAVAVTVVAPVAVAAAVTAAPGSTVAADEHREQVYGAPSASTDLTAALMLTARLPAAGALRRTAGRTLRDPVDRVAAVERLRSWAPPAAARTAARTWARDEGLHVDGSSRWLVLVSGSASAMAGAFGVDLVAASSPFAPGGPASYLRPARTPRVPGALRAHVDAVVGLDNRPVMRAHTHVAGKEPADLRSAYQQQAGTAGGAGLTVATVQFSSWTRNDLAVYAADKGIPNPLDRVTDVVVNGGTASDAAQIEVALDTEMVLATAPAAAQRVYNAPNTAAGAIAMYSAIADDAEDGKVQVLSSSWGACERNTTTEASLRTHIQRLVAAGGTVFASTGDFGSADCYRPSNPDLVPAVDVPASIPEVIGVGGTALTGNANAWQETAWGHGALSPQQGGSGGGVSEVFSLPDYQVGLPEAGTMRMVPDISAVGDPQTGVSSYNSDDGWIVVGGTSASAPINAGLFASSLSYAGIAAGVGSIHQALYDAPAADFRDPTTGSNGAYSADAGYDRVTGLGSPLWAELARDLGLVGSTYHTLTEPTRVMDTRNGTGVPAGKVPADSAVTLDLSDELPDGATSAVLNTTVTGTTRGGHLTVYPVSTAQPVVSNLNFAAGDTRANLVTVQLRQDQQMAFFSSSNEPVHVVADLQGYYAPDDTGATYSAISPTRVLDTRNGTGGPDAPLAARSVRTLTLPPALSGATAVVLNVTATRSSRRGYLTVYPGDSSRPLASSVNFGKAESTPNLVVVRLPANRQLAIYAGTDGPVDVVADLAGAFAVGPGQPFWPAAPVRILDSRNGTGGPSTPIPARATRVFTLPTRVPTGATAVLMNVTVTEPGDGGYLTVFPGTGTPPTASNLNFRAGDTIANLVAVAVNADRKLSLTNGSDAPVHVLADLAGNYAP